MDEHTYGTFTSEDGNHRTRVVLDEYGFDSKPDGCWFGTVYRFERGTVDILGQDDCVRNEDLSDTIEVTWGLWHDMDDVEMILRGTMNVCDHCEAVIDVNGQDSEGRFECDESEDGLDHEPRYDFTANPVVGFGYYDRDYGKLINVITLKDLQHWGFESLEAFQERNPGMDPSYNCLNDWVAWADGEVYYVVLEKRVQWQRLGSDGEPAFLEDPAMIETWEEIDACHGFYGTEYAEEYATTMLNYADSYNVA